MAANVNKVFLIGNLTRDPELRYVPSGTAVATFGIAVNRVFSDQSGQKKEDTCFIRVVVWGRRAEVCGEYLSKGRQVFVEGRLQSRSWEDSNGQKRQTVEVVANDVQFLGSPKEARGPAGSQAKQPAVQAGVPEIDIGTDMEQPSVSSEKGTEIKDSDVPF